MSVNNEEKTVKLVTQWNISAISYDDDSSAFEGSYMESWLNDTTVDGFLGNLRNYENFIVTDAKWDSTMDDRDLGEITRPNGEMIVTDTVGLLNLYEYQCGIGYLNNSLTWITLTTYNTSTIRYMSVSGLALNTGVNASAYGVRPSIILNSSIKIVDGEGTEDNPYRLEGDSDSNLGGVQLNTRYSGEYISFGTGENNLYRIVSHETEGLTKITSAEPLKENETFKTSAFGDNEYSSSNNTIGSFLNGEYLDSGYYLTKEQVNMIEDNTTWYLGAVENGTSYKLAKYIDTSMSGYATSTKAKVGLLRLGELMAGKIDDFNNNTTFWTLTPNNSSNVRNIDRYGTAYYNSPRNANGIRPSLNLKQNVIITGGDGTLQNPFQIALE